ncbi:MAG: hypothetical protein DMF78_06755 [Acidobacteria bacterium]|nr:MAG: hypothetical protein DMF78_06755 [Acidobacteriota bacterium]
MSGAAPSAIGSAESTPVSVPSMVAAMGSAVADGGSGSPGIASATSASTVGSTDASGVTIGSTGADRSNSSTGSAEAGAAGTGDGAMSATTESTTSVSSGSAPVTTSSLSEVRSAIGTSIDAGAASRSPVSAANSASPMPWPTSSIPISGTVARGRVAAGATCFCWWTSFSSRSETSARPGCARSTRLRIATALATKPSAANSSASPSRTGTASSARPACMSILAREKLADVGVQGRVQPIQGHRAVSGQAPRLGSRCEHPEEGDGALGEEATSARRDGQGGGRRWRTASQDT